MGDEPGEMGDALPAVALGTGRSAVGVGTSVDHTCVVLDNASLKCFGYNRDGLLGLGTDDERVGDFPEEMGDALPAVDLGTGRTAVSVSLGFFHTCALLDNAQVKCWGGNGDGSLGLATPIHAA